MTVKSRPLSFISLFLLDFPHSPPILSLLSTSLICSFGTKVAGWVRTEGDVAWDVVLYINQPQEVFTQTD